MGNRPLLYDNNIVRFGGLIMKLNLRIGDYIVPKKNQKGDNGERLEVISISDEAVKVLNLKNPSEVREITWEELALNYCGVDSINDKSETIESVIKKIQIKIKNKNLQNVKIDLGKIEAIIFPICEKLLKIIVFERRTWSGDIKTASYELPNDLQELKEAYPMLSNNIWDFSGNDNKAS